MWQDLQYSVRTLAKHRSFTLIAIFVLALGISLNSAIFTLINAFLFRPLAVPDSDQVRFVYLTDPDVPHFGSGILYADYLELRARRDLFADVLARASDDSQVTAGGDIRLTHGEMVSGSYFDVLQVRPMIGRSIAAADDDPAAEPVVVISASMWKSRFDSDPAVTGRTVQMDGRAYAVIGVMPEGFKGTLGAWELTQYWVPLRQRVTDMECQNPDRLNRGGFVLIARLRRDISEARVTAALAALRLRPTSMPAGAKPRDNLWTPTLFTAGRSGLPFGGFSRVIPERLATALFALAGIVLFIAGGNLTGMLSARGVARQTEIATRLALGASRWRVARQLLIESLLLASSGAVLGLLFARWMVAGFAAAVPAQFRRFDLSGRAPAQILSIDAPTDWRVIAYTVTICLIAATMVGLVPAIRASRTGLLGALASQGSAPRHVKGRLRHWIVVPQVCLSLMLLLVAGILVRSMTRAELMDHGYDTASLTVVSFDAPMPPWFCAEIRALEQSVRRRQPSPEEIKTYLAARDAFYGRVLMKARSIPGVTSVAIASAVPLEFPRVGGTWISGRDKIDGARPTTYISRVDASPDYFETLRIATVRGRTFDEVDVTSRSDVTVVSASLARVLWRDRNPIGQYVAFQEVTSPYPPQWHEVVGVVADVRSPMAADGWSRPAAYVPLQRGFARMIVARGSLPPPQLIAALKFAITDADPSARIGNGGTVQEAIDAYLYPTRLAAGVLAVSGLIGLLLASVGVYGVVSYSVAQRVREIGVRIALGASGRNIMTLVLREAGRVALVGSVLGLAFGFAAVRITSSRLIALPSIDVMTMAGAPALIAAVVAVACYVPARRAARVDPMTALRDL